MTLKMIIALAGGCWVFLFLSNIIMVVLLNCVFSAKTAKRVISVFQRYFLLQAFCSSELGDAAETMLNRDGFNTKRPDEKDMKNPWQKLQLVMLYLLELYLLIPIGYVILALILVLYGYQVFLNIATSPLGCLGIVGILISLWFPIPITWYIMTLIIILILCSVIQLFIDEAKVKKYLEESGEG